MVFSGEIGQINFQKDLPKGLPGMLEGFGESKITPFVNTGGAVAATYTITPPATVDANSSYDFTINGVPFSCATAGSPTKVTLGSSIQAAISSNAQIYRLVNTQLNGTTGAVTVVARFVNQALVIVNTNAKSLTNKPTIAQTVAPGSLAEIPFGRAVGTLGSYTIDPNSGLMPAALISTTGFTFKGFTVLKFWERSYTNPDLGGVYLPSQTMMVIENTGLNRPICVEAMEPDLKPSDAIHIQVSAGNEGKVTRSTTGTLDVSSLVKVVRNGFSANGKNCVYVAVKEA